MTPLRSSLAEMERWMDDIRAAVETASTSNGLSSDILSCSLTNNSKSLRSRDHAPCTPGVEKSCGVTVTHIATFK